MSGVVKVILAAIGAAAVAAIIKDVEKGLADGLKSAEPLSLSDSFDDGPDPYDVYGGLTHTF